MTTLPTIPAASITVAAITTVADRTGTIMLPRAAGDVATLIHQANASPIDRAFVQKAKGGEGTGTLGLYLEAVVLAGASQTPFTHMKFFVVGTHVYGYSRSNGDARANWRHRTAKTLQATLETVQKAIDRPNVKLFGHPVLVELTADDLSAIESGGMPPARFRGQYRIEKDFGRYDFEMEIVSANIPPSLIAALRNGFTI